ncbi:MAG TPA: Hsp20/alpha crystallin family protein [Candidatus Angelobacter sp.]|nr:Hsp20/alpha crystallin family protein [Candidatus Angelobacter sp.]
MANLNRWDPVTELTSVQDRLNQFFNQTVGGVARGLERSLNTANFMPPVDVYEDEHNIVLQVETPGMDEKDIDIRLDNNVLTISGERKLKNEEKKDNFHRIEREYGRFTRSFTLPGSVDPERITAEAENGILKITIAKSEKFKSRQIKIGASKTLPGKEKVA